MSSQDIHTNLKLRYGTSVDIWAIGCVFYQLLVGHHPFDWPVIDDDRRWARVALNIIKGNVDGPSLESRSAKPMACLDFFSGMVESCPYARLTAAEALAHSYYADSENEQRDDQ